MSLHHEPTVLNFLRSSNQPSASAPWQGKLDLQFSRHHTKTQQKITHIQAPLKAQRPFYPEGPATCHSTILHTAGGMVGGDRLDLNLHLAPQTQVLITTPAATKIYGPGNISPAHAPLPPTHDTLPHLLPAHQTIHCQLSAQAHLTWVPQETILFNGARYHQRLKVELEPGATWLGWEISRLGRSARGEQFLQGHWQSRTEVWQQGQLVWLDPQSVPGNPEVWASPHGLYGQPIVASLAWVGPEVEPELVHQVRILGQEILARSSDASSPPLSPLSSPPLSPQAKSEMGATRLRSGLLCRYRGNSSLEAKQWFWAVWNLLRQTYQGKSACYPRIWPRQTTKI